MRLISVLAAAILTTIPLHASAQEQECSAIADDTERLACYDGELEDPAAVVSSRWQVLERQSPIDDSTNVILISDSMERVRNPYGEPRLMHLLIACRENTTSAWISFAGHFMSDLHHGTVTVRIDDSPAREVEMEESNDNQSLGLWVGRQAIPFVRTLFGADSLFIRATPLNESAVSATFTITGLEESITPLRESCGW